MNGSLLSIVVIMLASSTAIYTVCVCVCLFFVPHLFFLCMFTAQHLILFFSELLFFVRVSHRHTVVGKSKYEYVLIKSQPLPSDDSLSFFL